MAYTEKVSISGTALSFLIYECASSMNGQEGFLIGDITSEITNHISDSQSDNARLDTEIVIKTVLPLPAVSQFYFPTGRVKEDVVSELLSNTASEVVGWYRYRRNNSLKPTLRDKLISRGLQKYFEKNHGKKNFVMCSVTSRASSSGATHTFAYRFGKINCFDMYEYIEDVTANLGEKLTGYKKAHRRSHSVYNKIIQEINVQSETNSEAIFSIQRAVDARLLKEAKIAVKTEKAIKELEAEIKHMTTILSERHRANLTATAEVITHREQKDREWEMAEACVEALKPVCEANLLNLSDYIPDYEPVPPEVEMPHAVNNDVRRICSSPVPTVITCNTTPKNYAAALKSSTTVISTPSTSKTKVCDDLIDLDVDLDNKVVKKLKEDSEEIKILEDSSPEY